MADTRKTQPHPASKPATSPERAKDDPAWAPESGDKPDAAQPRRDEDQRQQEPSGSQPSDGKAMPGSR